MRLRLACEDDWYVWVLWWMMVWLIRLEYRRWFLLKNWFQVVLKSIILLVDDCIHFRIAFLRVTLLEVSSLGFSHYDWIDWIHRLICSTAAISLVVAFRLLQEDISSLLALLLFHFSTIWSLLCSNVLQDMILRYYWYLCPIVSTRKSEMSSEFSRFVSARHVLFRSQLLNRWCWID